LKVNKTAVTTGPGFSPKIPDRSFSGEPFSPGPGAADLSVWAQKAEKKFYVRTLFRKILSQKTDGDIIFNARVSAARIGPSGPTGAGTGAGEGVTAVLAETTTGGKPMKRKLVLVVVALAAGLMLAAGPALTAQAKCPAGQIFSVKLQKCVPLLAKCPPGCKYSPKLKKCVCYRPCICRRGCQREAVKKICWCRRPLPCPKICKPVSGQKFCLCPESCSCPRGWVWVSSVHMCRGLVSPR
jgi:hypothetical protein